jgi:hypothetical protein
MESNSEWWVRLLLREAKASSQPTVTIPTEKLEEFLSDFHSAVAISYDEGYSAGYEEAEHEHA